jgi:hypothetical protein
VGIRKDSSERKDRLRRRGSTKYVLHLAELRDVEADVEADVEGDGRRELRARREWKRWFRSEMGSFEEDTLLQVRQAVGPPACR